MGYSLDGAKLLLLTRRNDPSGCLLEPRRIGVHRQRRVRNGRGWFSIGRVAYPEAGHACMAAHLGEPLESVEIIEDHSDIVGPGRALIVDDGTATTIRKQVEVFLAGPVAQVIACGRPHWFDAALAWRRDAERVAAWLDHLPPEHRRGVHELCELETFAALRGLWPQVEAVAAALIEHRKLTGREVRGLMRDAEPLTQGAQHAAG